MLRNGRQPRILNRKSLRILAPGAVALGLIGVVALLAFAPGLSSDARASGTPQVTYTGNAVSEYYFDPTGFFCAFGVTATAMGIGTEDYYLEVGILLELDSADPDDVAALTPSFQPLVIGGVPVVLEPAPCSRSGGTTKCKVADAIPPEPTHRWIQFRSTTRLPATAGSSSFDFVIEAFWRNETTKTVRTTRSAVWVSDDRDDVHGYLVGDYFEEGPFPYMIPECMGKDGTDVHVLYANGSVGPFIEVQAGFPLDVSILKPAAGGNGKYVAHLNAGVPDPFTVTNFGFGLGNVCFPFLLPPNGSAAPVSIWNNIGKTSRVGSSNYFGVPADTPDRAPAFLLKAPGGDVANLPSGSQWTLQAITVNPASSSVRGASVTNVLEIEIQ